MSSVAILPIWCPRMMITPHTNNTSTSSGPSGSLWLAGGGHPSIFLPRGPIQLRCAHSLAMALEFFFVFFGGCFGFRRPRKFFQIWPSNRIWLVDGQNRREMSSNLGAERTLVNLGPMARIGQLRPPDSWAPYWKTKTISAENQLVRGRFITAHRQG